MTADLVAEVARSHLGGAGGQFLAFLLARGGCPAWREALVHNDAERRARIVRVFAAAHGRQRVEVLPGRTPRIDELV